MNFALDQDHQYWDNTISLTLTSFRNTGSVVQDVAVAKQRPINKKELAASNGAYLEVDSIFKIPAALLLEGNPKLRDTVVTSEAPDTTYTVIGVEGICRDSSGNPQRWVLTARNPIIAYDLRDQIVIEQADDDYSGVSVVRKWPSTSAGGKVLYSQLPCRVQPQQASTVDERGLQGQETKYLIYVSKQITLPNVRECRVLWNGKVLGRLEYREAEQIDRLPILSASLET